MSPFCPRYLLFALIAWAPALAAAGELRLEGPLVQGALVRGFTEVGEDSVSVSLSKAGVLERESAPRRTLES